MSIITSVLDFFMPAALAHEKWFVDPQAVRVPSFPEWSLFSPRAIIAAVLIILLAVIAWRIDRRLERSTWYIRVEERIKPLRDFAPGVLAVLTGIFLFLSASRGVLLGENFPLPPGVPGAVLHGIELISGGLLIAGLFTPLASGLLLALFTSTFFYFPASEPFDYLYFVGIAYFLFFFARGRYSLDWFLGKPMYSTNIERKRAFIMLRVMTGVALAVLALGKWMRPDLHLALLDRFPGWNPYVLLQRLHLAPAREAYVFILGGIELLAAVFLTTGIFARYTALFLIPVFAASIFFIGPTELIGHLPIIGALFAVFVYGDLYEKITQEQEAPS